MSNKILGRNGFAELFLTDTWYPVFCFKSCELNIEDEEIEKTGPTSGRSREFTYGYGSAMFRVSGVSTIDNSDGNISPLWFLQHRTDIHELRINLTDQDGNQQVISFNALMRRTTITNDVTQWSQATIEFRITGDIDTGDIISPPSPDELFSDFWETTPGATTVTGTSAVYGYSLSGITPISVYREGLEHDLIVSGSPVNRTAKYNSGVPNMQFPTDIPFNPGERVFIVFTQ